MLRGIPDVIGSDLLKALADTGHGDLIVIADHFYPPVTKSPQAISIQAKGVGVPQMLDAILKLVPLDVEYEKTPIKSQQFFRLSVVFLARNASVRV